MRGEFFTTESTEFTESGFPLCISVSVVKIGAAGGRAGPDGAALRLSPCEKAVSRFACHRTPEESDEGNLCSRRFQYIWPQPQPPRPGDPRIRVPVIILRNSARMVVRGWGRA